MLTTVPWEEFVALTKGVKEDNDSKKSFNWNNMLKHSQSYKEIQKYVSETNCKLVGSGSARIAFFLPAGAYDTKRLNEPSCFKVARDEGKGPAQNKAEVNVINKFGANGKYVCFPKLYDWDKENFYFMLCEVGTPLDDVPEDQEIKYFSKWDPWIKKHYPKYSTDMKIRDNLSLFDILNEMNALIHEDEPKGFSQKAIIEEMAGDIPEYSGIADFIKFMYDGGGLKEGILFGDFLNADNWGVVMRNGKLSMIPLDWGFTNEVAEKWY